MTFDVRDAALVSPRSWKARLLWPGCLADNQSALVVNTHAIAASALFRTIARACGITLGVCRGFRATVDYIIVAKALTAVLHSSHAVAETNAGGDAILYRQRTAIRLLMPQNAAANVVDVAALVGPTRWESWTCSLGDKS